MSDGLREGPSLGKPAIKPLQQARARRSKGGQAQCPKAPFLVIEQSL